MIISSPEFLKLEFIDAGRGNWTEGADFDDGWLHMKTVPYIIIAQVTEGMYRIKCGNNSPVNIPTGNAFLTPPNSPLAIEHIFNPLSKQMKARWIHCNFNINNTISIASIFKFPPIIEKKWADKFGKIADKIFELQNSQEHKNLKHAALISSLAFSSLYILLDFLEEKKICPDINEDKKRLFPSIEYARKNIHRSISVEELSSAANLSPSRFHVEFKRIFNDTPSKYIKKIRLHHAVSLLRTTKFSLKEIATKTGFCNEFHLSREFKKLYGISPAQYLSRLKKTCVTPTKQR